MTAISARRHSMSTNNLNAVDLFEPRDGQEMYLTTIEADHLYYLGLAEDVQQRLADGETVKLRVVEVT